MVKFSIKSNDYCLVCGLAYLDIGTKKYPGMEAIVDEADLDIVLDGKGRWYARKGQTTFYATREIAGTAQQMHRHLLGLAGGHSVIPDHEDHNGLNNTRQNLRLTNHVGNKANSRSQLGRPYKGVFFNSKSGRWRAIIQAYGERVHLGYFDTAELASAAYDAAARERFGEFALTNERLS